MLIDVAFHEGMCRLTGNGMLLEPLARINERMRAFRAMDFANVLTNNGVEESCLGHIALAPHGDQLLPPLQQSLPGTRHKQHGTSAFVFCPKEGDDSAFFILEAYVCPLERKDFLQTCPCAQFLQDEHAAVGGHS